MTVTLKKLKINHGKIVNKIKSNEDKIHKLFFYGVTTIEKIKEAQKIEVQNRNLNIQRRKLLKIAKQIVNRQSVA